MTKKSLIILISITITSFLLFTGFKLSTKDNDYIYVRVQESADLTFKSKIVVTDGKTVLKTSELGLIRSKNLDDNIIQISSVLSSIKSQGYSLVSSCKGGIGVIVITDYVFEKK